MPMSQMDPKQKEYLDLMNSRAALEESMADGSVTDESGEIPDSAGSQDVMKTRQMQDQMALEENKNTAGAKNAGAASQAGGAMMAGGAMAGNPYVAGAGLALQTVGAVDNAVRSSEQAKIDAYNKKIMAQRSAIRNFFA